MRPSILKIKNKGNYLVGLGDRAEGGEYEFFVSCRSNWRRNYYVIESGSQEKDDTQCGYEAP